MTVVSTDQGQVPRNTNKMPDIEKIVEGFPRPNIHPIIGIPTYEGIAEIHIKLNLNAASVHSELGNGALGLLALTVTPAVYNTLAGVPFVPPANPANVRNSAKFYWSSDRSA
mgnify:CR=1 FL=1